MEGLQELQKSISKVMEHSDNVWVLGDFNLPKLQWPDCEPLIKPDCFFKQVYDYFIEILDDNNLTQVVTQPTRLNNTLDLFLTTKPTLIKEVKCQPCLADHDMVSAESLLKPTTHKQKPRKTFIFKKADWPALKLKLKQFQESFIKSSPGKSVEVLWHDFTSTLNKLCEECIPSKHILGKSSLPWITQEIKHLIKKSDSLYTQYKKKGDQTARDQFQALRQKIKKKIKTTYNGYLNDLLELSENNKTCDRKKLFSFLKNSRRDQEDIPPLKENDTLFIETHAKANICNRQFQSVFTCKITAIPVPFGPMKVQDLVDEGSLPLGSVPDTNLSSVPIMPTNHARLRNLSKWHPQAFEKHQTWKNRWTRSAQTSVTEGAQG